MSGWMFLVFGLLAGMRHALEPDHVATVGALAARHRCPAAAVAVGVFWGLGHTVAIAMATAFFAVTGLVPPPPVFGLLEALVAAVVLVLGIDLLRRLRRAGWHVLLHRHDGRWHFHLHAHPHLPGHHHGIDAEHLREHAGRGRALAIGMLHGLAGSGAAIAVLAAAGGLVTGLLAVGAFGVGSILAMVALAWPLGVGSARLIRPPALLVGLQVVLGGFAALVGLIGLVAVLDGTVAG